MNTQKIIGIFLFLFMGVLAVADQLSRELAVLLGLGGAVFIVMGSQEEEIISLKEAKKVARTEIKDLQATGEISAGEPMFENEADVTRDQEGKPFYYDLVYSVTSDEGVNYFMCRIGKHGAFSGITKLNRDTSILKTDRRIITTGTSPEQIPRRSELREDEKEETASER